MLSDWHREIEIEMRFEDWKRLPRLAGFKCEYLEGRALWTPRAKQGQAVLDLEGADLAALAADTEYARSDGIAVTPLKDADWPNLIKLFGGAFGELSPFKQLSDEEFVRAVDDCLSYTRRGGDGPFMPEVSLVCRDDEDNLLGAMLITGYVDRSRENTEGPAAQPPPPHLNWLFVHPWERGHGVASLMLLELIPRLRDTGHRQLFSTFDIGNDASILWHWRNGFRLLPNPYSMRQWSRRKLTSAIDKPDAPKVPG